MRMESPASANQVPRRWRAVLSGLESAVSAVEVGTASGAQIEDAVRLLDSTANAPPLPRSLWKKLVMDMQVCSTATGFVCTSCMCL